MILKRPASSSSTRTGEGSECASGSFLQSKTTIRCVLAWSGLEWENHLTAAAGLNRSVSPLCRSCATPYRRATSLSVLETGVGGVEITVLVDGCGGHAAQHFSLLEPRSSFVPVIGAHDRERQACVETHADIFPVAVTSLPTTHDFRLAGGICISRQPQGANKLAPVP